MRMHGHTYTRAGLSYLHPQSIPREGMQLTETATHPALRCIHMHPTHGATCPQPSYENVHHDGDASLTVCPTLPVIILCSEPTRRQDDV